MRKLIANGVRIDDTFAEAFGMRATALIVTADSAAWARQAAATMTGFATSVIGCGCEAAIDREIGEKQTPDGRPGVRVLLFAVSTGELQKQLAARVGQCVLTSPGSACYAGLDGEESLKLGNALRYFRMTVDYPGAAAYFRCTQGCEVTPRSAQYATVCRVPSASSRPSRYGPVTSMCGPGTVPLSTSFLSCRSA